MADVDAEATSFLNLLNLKDLALPSTYTNRHDVNIDGSFRVTGRVYDEIHVPGLRPGPFEDSELLVAIENLPKYAQPSFEGFQTLNRIQSRLCKAALENDDNLLLCAPIGAGKTNIALLIMLREIGKNINPCGEINADQFKIVYITPIKSVIQKRIEHFRSRLHNYGIKVDELTDDHQWNKEKIRATQIIVSTPEKWDITTRRGDEKIFRQLIHLIIIDDVHLLHDERGPVLEAIVARTIGNCEAMQEKVRIVGFSVPCLNYKDIASFLRVPDQSVYVDDSYGPPKQQLIQFHDYSDDHYRTKLNTDILYDKIMQYAGKNQVLVFVHSVDSTAEVAQAMRDLCLKNGSLGKFFREGSDSIEVLTREARVVKDHNLQNVLPHGFGICHDRMNEIDRKCVENLFANKHLQVLVLTYSLAWYGNFHSNTVIIRGTKVFNSDKGRSLGLGLLDIMQMMSRAGKPQFDMESEVILMATDSEKQYYFALMNQQIPIESQFVTRLVDNLNAEIVLGTVQNIKDAVKWLGYTYFYQRMVSAPSLYRVPLEVSEIGPPLKVFMSDLIHTAACNLDKNSLIKYDKKRGHFQVTELGRIASHFNISPETMSAYNLKLKSTMCENDLLKVFSLSSEFQGCRIIVIGDVPELSKMLKMVPITTNDNIINPGVKVLVLLQVYISQLLLERSRLVSDMISVAQSAMRLMRAIFFFALHRGWAQLAKLALSFSKMIEKRIQRGKNPLYQITDDEEVLKITEATDIDQELHNLAVDDATMIGRRKEIRERIYRCINSLPKLNFKVLARPFSNSTVQVELTITSNFQWDEKIHGQSEAFWIIVVDFDEEVILHHEYFLLKKKFCSNEHHLKFVVPVSKPLSLSYFIHVISDKWIGTDAKITMSLEKMILLKSSPPPIVLLDLKLLPLSVLGNSEFESLYQTKIKNFNLVQTQTFTILFKTNDNVFIGAPTGSGKTLCLELAILRMFMENPDQKCIYIAPVNAVAQLINEEWQQKFGKIGKKVVVLTGELSTDHKLVSEGHIVIATPEVLNILSRSWKQMPIITNISLFLIDDLHLLGGGNGPVLEMVISRMQYMSSKIGRRIRIVAVSSSISNAIDVGLWLGCKKKSIFNFHPNVRPVRLEILTQGFNVTHNASRIMSMTKPVYNTISYHSPKKPVIVFVPSRTQTVTTAYDLISLCAADLWETKFLHAQINDISPDIERLQDKIVEEAVIKGVGYLHEDLCDDDRKIVEKLFDAGDIQILVVSRNLAWSMKSNSYLVIIMDTQCYNGKIHAYEDYPIADVLQMIGRANRPLMDKDAKAVILCQHSKLAFYKNFLFEPLLIESNLDHCLHDHFNAEIAAEVIRNKWEAVDTLKLTFLYKRMTQNPNYYGVQGITPRHLSERMSELVETALRELEHAKCIVIEEGFNVSAKNLGLVASRNYINYNTIELLGTSINRNTMIGELIEIIAKATEYENIPIRHHEDYVLKQLAERISLELQNPNFSDPHLKTQLLLKAHISRVSLTPELMTDIEYILSKAFRLIKAFVEVSSINGWFHPALEAMKLSQMVTQAMQRYDSYLKQLPHFNSEVIKRFNDKNIDSIFDIMDMNKQDRDELIQMTDKEQEDVASFILNYPNIKLHYEIEKEEAFNGAEVNVKVFLERKVESTDEFSGGFGLIVAPHCIQGRKEGWWLVIGEPNSGNLLAIKNFTVQEKAMINLEFNAPIGDHQFALYLINDAYLGCDRKYDFIII